MITYNYTSAVKRESRTYAFDNVKISSTGISGGVLKTSAACVGVFNVIGVIVCFAQHKILYIPMIFGATLQESGIFLAIFVLLPVLIAIGLKKKKIMGYDLITFLYLYLKPKPMVDAYGKKINLHEDRIEGFMTKF